MPSLPAEAINGRGGCGSFYAVSRYLATGRWDHRSYDSNRSAITAFRATMAAVAGRWTLASNATANDQ
jgi:hypothetical protein